MVDLRLKEWQAKFGELNESKKFVKLTGETSADLRLLEEGDVILCTPAQVCLILHPTLIFDHYLIVGCRISAMEAAKKCPDHWIAHRGRDPINWWRSGPSL